MNEIDFGIYEQGLLAYMNDTPRLLSLLYDIDLMPEQTMGDEDLYRKTLIIIASWKDNEKVDNESTNS